MSRENLFEKGAEFTRERLEGIRQLEGEIDSIEEPLERARQMLVEALKGRHRQAQGWLPCQATVDITRWCRILAREQAALAELKKGMK